MKMLVNLIFVSSLGLSSMLGGCSGKQYGISDGPFRIQIRQASPVAVVERPWNFQVMLNGELPGAGCEMKWVTKLDGEPITISEGQFYAASRVVPMAIEFSQQYWRQYSGSRMTDPTNLPPVEGDLYSDTAEAMIRVEIYTKDAIRKTWQLRTWANQRVSVTCPHCPPPRSI